MIQVNLLGSSALSSFGVQIREPSRQRLCKRKVLIRKLSLAPLPEKKACGWLMLELSVLGVVK